MHLPGLDRRGSICVQIFLFWTLISISVAEHAVFQTRRMSDSSLSGKLAEVFDGVPIDAQPSQALGPLSEEDGAGEEKSDSLAVYLDKKLEVEFKNEEIASQTKTDLNETLSKEKGSHLEQVVKVSRSTKPKGNSTEEQGPHSGTGEEEDLDEDIEDGGNEHEDVGEQDVDRLIDADSNEYVLSRSKGGVALTLDPLLIQDVTVVLTASSIFGTLFEAIRQPTLNGYLLAGSLIGPDGLALVKELVQVESLAQVGVQLLLFGLGMEFSIDKMRQVGSVAILGGLLEIILFILCSALGSILIGGALSEGIFVGALLSMSSTSVVVKTLGDRANSTVSQIVIGTLILQDCSVGLMFALMPVLSSLNDPASGLDPEATGEIVLLILKVLFKLALVLAGAAAFSRSLVPTAIAYIRKNYSDELFQMFIVAYCLSCAWICGKLGLSHELGAFLAGIMVSTMPQHEDMLHSTVQVRNVFTGLFLASIGLVISPVFILEHVRLLGLGALVVLIVKGALISIVVWNFKYSWNVSLAVGFSLAQVGEFAFVLLSLASQLGLINNRLAMLLLGITAISLLTTPLVLSLTLHILNPDGNVLPYTSLAATQLSANLKHSRSALSDNDDNDVGPMGPIHQPTVSDPIPEADIRKLHARNGRPTGATMEGVLQRRDSSGQVEAWSPSQGDSQRHTHSRRHSPSGEVSVPSMRSGRTKL